MSQKEQPIRIIVAGPAASGKTAIVSLIADLLSSTAGFENVFITYPEQIDVSEMKAKAAALVAGEMNQVLKFPIEIIECGSIREEGHGNFGGTFYRREAANSFIAWKATGEGINTHFARISKMGNTETEQAMVDSRAAKVEVFSSKPDTSHIPNVTIIDNK